MNRTVTATIVCTCVSILMASNALAQAQTPTANQVVPESAGTPLLNVAVVDVNTVALKVGSLDEMQASVNAKKQEIQDRLAVLNEGYTKGLLDAQKRYGTTPSEEQNKELTDLTNQYTAGAIKAQQQAQLELSQHENQLKLHFLNSIRPIAYQVATEHGFEVVLTTQQVFAAGPDSDLTEHVVKRILSQKTTTGELPTEISQDPSRGGVFQVK